MRLPILALALLSAIAMSAEAACSPDDMTLRQSRMVVSTTSSVRVLGEVVSACAEPAGILMTFAFRGKDGGVVGVDQSWGPPRRIEAKGNLPFDVFSTPVERPTSVDPAIAVVPIR